MGIQFIRECNYISETLLLLARYFSKESVSQLREKLSNKTGYTKEEDIILKNLEKAYHDIVSQVDIPEHIGYYFEGFNGEEAIDTTIANCMLDGCMNHNITYETMGISLKEQFKTSQSEFQNAIISNEGSDKDLTDTEFMKKIDDLNVEDQLKWHIWNVYKNFDKHVDIVMDIVLKIVPIMKETYQYYLGEFTSFYEYWEDKCTDYKAFSNSIDTILKLDLTEKSSVMIRPTFMGCNSIRLFANSGEETALMHMQIGFMFKDNIQYRPDTYTKEELCARLKLFSDSSKYEIMKLTKDEHLYGSQLADKLGLTTATISHHVSALTSVGLITIEKDSNRIYYRLNKPQVAQILDQVRSDLFDD